MPFHGPQHHLSLREASRSAPQTCSGWIPPKSAVVKTCWDSVVWVTCAIISLLLCSPPSFLALGLYWAFCSDHCTILSLTLENARRGTLKVYLGFSFHWVWHLWPIIIKISKWILSKEMIHTNNNFVKMCGTLPDSGRSAALGSRLKYITATREILWVYYPQKVYCPGKLLLYKTHAKLIL